ncbi:MAG: metalloregulator ArsR/SmtB family transcription factor [Anaerolineae bacterium]
MERADRLARFFKALADGTRLRLVALLAQQEPGSALCVGRLAAELETTSSNVSQHLRVLKDLGLVHRERRGYRIHYFLDEERLIAYRRLGRDLLGIDLLGESMHGAEAEHECGG